MNETEFQNVIEFLLQEIQENKNQNLLFKEIKERFNAAAIRSSFKIILDNYSNTKLIDFVIRTISKTLEKEDLSLLVDFILRPNLNSDFISLKVLAIKTIPNFKDSNSVSVLLYCLNDKNSNYKIKLASAEALGKIGDAQAFESLGKILTDENEKSTYIKESAATALGMIGDDRAIDVFSSIMDTKEIFKEKFSFLKEKIMEAISKFDISRNKKALKILKKSLYDNSENVRISAIETLMNSQLEESYSLIYEVFKYDSNIEVKKNALVALFNISCDVKIIEEAIKSDYPQELKEFAIQTLKDIEDSE